MKSAIRNLRRRPSLVQGALAGVLVTLLAGLSLRPVTAMLVGWDAGILVYGVGFLIWIMRHSTPESLKRMSVELDEGQWGVLLGTIAGAVASLVAIVLELAGAHGQPHAVFSEVLGGVTVLLSWVFIHTIFATHYASEFWHDGKGLIFPGNPAPDYGEFLYFSYCMAVASQVSDVATQTPEMRRLVLVHSLISYVFNTAVIALGVNIAASLAN